ncbi:hypothetical protein GQ457_13G014700 [Hibiscus cannabinus]
MGGNRYCFREKNDSPCKPGRVPSGLAPYRFRGKIDSLCKHRSTQDRKVITCLRIIFQNTPNSLMTTLVSEQEDTVHGYQTSEVYAEPQASSNEK